MHLTDYTSSNILLQIADIDAWSEQEIFHKLGQPIKVKVRAPTGQDIGPSAPAYQVEPVLMSNIDPQYLRDEILVVDFGLSFFNENPPANGVGTLASYAAPEIIFDNQASFWSDIWALGCIIFEIRSGEQVFESFFGGYDEVVRQMVQTFGKPPEPWWNSWEVRSAYFNDHGKPKQNWKKGIALAVEYPLVKHIADIGSGDGEDGNDEDEGDGKILSGEEDELLDDKGTKLSSEEADLLEDLLTRIIKYTPNQRLTLKDIVNHGWSHH